MIKNQQNVQSNRLNKITFEDKLSFIIIYGNSKIVGEVTEDNVEEIFLKVYNYKDNAEKIQELLGWIYD